LKGRGRTTQAARRKVEKKKYTVARKTQPSTGIEKRKERKQPRGVEECVGHEEGPNKN